MTQGQPGTEGEAMILLDDRTHPESCDACHKRPAGHGHFALYCAACAELPYGVVAP